MPETSTAIADIHMLDSGYSREARSLLYQAYRHEPTFGYLFEAERPGYEPVSYTHLTLPTIYSV